MVRSRQGEDGFGAFGEGHCRSVFGAEGVELRLFGEGDCGGDFCWQVFDLQRFDIGEGRAAFEEVCRAGFVGGLFFLVHGD